MWFEDVMKGIQVRELISRCDSIDRMLLAGDKTVQIVEILCTN